MLLYKVNEANIKKLSENKISTPKNVVDVSVLPKANEILLINQVTEGGKVNIDNLPSILKRVLIEYDKPDYMLMLLSLICVLSGIFPKVYSSYHSKKVYANLFGYILGRAGIGKGKMNDVRMLISNINGYVAKSNSQILKDFLANPKEYKVKPEHPLILPGNSTFAGYMVQLARNEGNGITIETEGDTVGAMFKNEHGDYSDLVRKGFQHEEISQFRKSDDPQYITMEEPKLSMLISSTYGQLGRIVPSSENGMFSRFFYYKLKGKEDFVDVYAKDASNFKQAYKEVEIKIAKLLLKIHEVGDIEFKLTREQEQKLIAKFQEYKTMVNEMFDADLAGTINRMGLITHRIAMLLTILRNEGDSTITNKIICNDNDFQFAIELTGFLITQSSEVLNIIQGNNKSKKTLNSRETNKQTLYKMLPETKIFSTKEAKELGEKYTLSDRTVDRFLRTPLLFEDLGHGKWKKVKQEENKDE